MLIALIIALIIIITVLKLMGISLGVVLLNRHVTF